MSSLKDALVRVTRVVRSQDRLRRLKNPAILLPTPPAEPRHVRAGTRERIPKRQLDQLRPHLQGLLKKRYQKFLEPLNMPQLKIYDTGRPPYDVERAERNLAMKKSQDRVQVFAHFLGERQTFDKMLDLLVQLTPPELKDRDLVQNLESLARTLEREDGVFKTTRHDSVPRFHFHELPPMPDPLTKENFYEYIYFLTHSKIYYRNSSSLLSGIVPEMLLYTHNLAHEHFKPYRSTETFNCLIKYFGYDRIQISFARELLLVMVRDGHTPNINTINQLLKICRVHANRRSLVSTYKVVTNYLNLAKRLDLRINLSTWNRIYDCCDNIFLKEAFLNKMLAVNLPVLSNMCIRIVEDFNETTKDTHEVIRFVELDLRRPHWRQDPRLAEKVLYHKIRQMSCNADLSLVFEGFLAEIATDELTLKNITNAIVANPNFTHKAFLILCMYTQLSTKYALVTPEIYVKAVKLLCDNPHRYEIANVNFIVRGIVHDDARRMLNLPIETVEYGDGARAESKGHKMRFGPQFPYRIPKGVMSEHYKIFKRMSLDSLNALEAKVIHANNTTANGEIKYPWVLLSKEEERKWALMKNTIMAQERFWENAGEKAQSVGLVKSKSRQASKQAVFTYQKHNSMQKTLSSEIDTVRRLKAGFNESIEKEMKERHIFTAP